VTDGFAKPDLPATTYEHICRTASAALIATDAEGRITCWNEAATDLLGADSRAMLGHPLGEIVPEALREAFGEMLQAALTDGQTHQFEMALTGGDQTRRSVLATVAPLRDAAGDTLGLVAWMMDQTRATRLREQLAKHQRMASLGTLAGGVAHHFNNILGGVATFVDYALTSGDETVMRRALQMTADAVSRATRLTGGLLEFAEQDVAKQDLADLTEVLLTFAHTAEPALSARSISVTVNVDALPVMAVDAGRMYHVLRRLMANAEEAIDGAGEITLEARRDVDEVVLKLADTGCGIDAESLGRVFEPFFTTKGVLGGGQDESHIGLGLSVAHGTIADMGGSLDIDSVPGSGSVVTIRLPVPRSGP